MKRVFLGIDLPIEIKDDIEKLKKNCHLEKLPIKLVELNNSHIAVKFMAELSLDQIKKINGSIKKVVLQFPPFKITIKDYLVFPNMFQPRILALKVLSQNLISLANVLINELEKFSFIIKDNRPYTPHITLGRIKNNLSVNQNELFKKIEFSKEILINHLTLFESNLTSSGPNYTIIKEYQLK